MPEASIAGRKAHVEDVARTGGAREGNNRLSATSAMLTWAEEHGRLTVARLRKPPAGR